MEQVLLVIAGVIVLLVLLLFRKWPHPNSLSKRAEAVVRILLCFVFALGIHAYYSAKAGFGFTWFLGALSSALLLYAVTHLLDRLILMEG